MRVSLFVFSCVLWAQAAVWRSWSSPYPIRGAVVAGRGVWLATGGGLRWIDEDLGDFVYTAQHGLEETAQSAVAISPDGFLYALSDRGILSWLSPRLNRFEVISRSMVENADKPLPQGLLLRPGYAVVGFAHRVVLVDLNSRLAKISFTQIGNLNLQRQELTGIALRGDTLYVSGDSLLYRRYIPFDTLDRDRRLADPSTWALAATLSGGIGHFYFENGQLRLHKSPGMTAWETDGMDRILYNGGGVWLRGDSLSDTLLYDSSGRALPFWVGRIAQDSSRWLVGKQDIWRYRRGRLELKPPWGVYPPGLTTTVDVYPGGDIVAWAYPWQVRIRTDGSVSWRGFLEGSSIIDDSREQAAAQPLKTLAQDSAGMVFTGTWGGALFVHDAMGNLYGNYHEVTGHCIDSWLGTYPVVRGVSRVDGGQGIFLAYWGVDGVRRYGVGWVDPQYRLYCAPDVGSAVPSGPVQAYLNSQGQWVVFSAYSASVGSTTNGGVDWFVFGGVAGETLQLVSKKEISTGDIGYPRDLEWDAGRGRLWMVSASKLGYWEAGMDSVRVPLMIRGIGAVEFTAVEADLRGNLWLATRSDGVFIAKPRRGSPDTLDAVRLTSRDGLLSMSVLDISIDSVEGRVVFAHDVGVSVYYTAEVRSGAGYMRSGAPAVKVYPNPFRPGRHSLVTFEFVGEKGEVILYNAAGIPVCSFRGASLTGGRLEWDGRLDDGSLILPGVYHYLARQGDRVQRGRLLVIR